MPRDKRPSKNSRFAPIGYVRVTANMRADLHLRLKLVAAHRRTTVGALLEEYARLL